jgi:hypothetical protein
MIGAQPQEGPDLNPLSRRALIESEIALAKATLGARIDYDIVAVRSGSGGNPIAWLALLGTRTDAITLIRTIYFKTLDGDFSERRSGLFLHEMTHIWQYQAFGALRFYWRYLMEWLRAGLRQNNLYRYDEGRTAFADARLEAQAQMVQDYYDVSADGDEGKLEQIGRNLAGSGFYGL